MNSNVDKECVCMYMCLYCQREIPINDNEQEETQSSFCCPECSGEFLDLITDTDDYNNGGIYD